MRKITKKDVWQHVAILAGIVVFIIINKYVNRIDEEIETANNIVVACIYKTGRNGKAGTSYCKYFFYVDGIKYNGVDSYDESGYRVKYRIEIGDFYEIRYHTRKKEYTELLLDCKVPRDSVYTYFDGVCPFDVE